MPAAYAHDAFGMDVLEMLPGPFQRIIRAQPNLYHTGLQGPDLFFYYHPLRANLVSEAGHAIHRQPGLAFMKRMAEAAEKRGWDDASRAFLYGNICHFILDRECHGTIFRFTETSGVTHAEIEGELDRALMVEAGEDPLRTMPARHIHPDRKDAEVIHAFYPEFPAKLLFSCMKSFRGFNVFLTMPQERRRRPVFALMRRLGVYESLHGHFINREENPLCHDNSQKLMALYRDAIGEAADLIVHFEEMATGREAWSPLYDMNYESDYGL